MRGGRSGGGLEEQPGKDAWLHPANQKRRVLSPVVTVRERADPLTLRRSSPLPLCDDI